MRGRTWTSESRNTGQRSAAHRHSAKYSARTLLILLFSIVVVATWLARRRSPAAPMWRPVDGARAFEDLQNVVKFGPRPPGSVALGRTRQYISTGLAADGIEVWHDNFTASTPTGDIAMTNIIGIVPGESSSIVIVAGHYDTARLEGIRFIGANDGGSSTALLLELARVLAGRKNRLTYWLVFFDGEEALQRWSTTDSLYGSRHMAQQFSADGRLKKLRALILVDMIGDRHLNVIRDSNSTLWLSDLVLRSAHRLGYDKFFRGGTHAVEDDHLPFVARGVSAVDIIDLTPFQSYHHTDHDTPERCNPESLAIVARVVLATLDRLERSFH